ncbi:hypothetical protein N9040_10105, partial [Akkermansiaceae bacterium]|nr:hypothetical protein [Akkermansiaceae bacterium]
MSVSQIRRYAVSWNQRIREMRQLRQNAKLVGGPSTVFATRKKLVERKTSDTLFVLGCGSSINEITEPEWERIGQYDTFGFNFWAIHDFVPTYYMLECSFNQSFLDLMIDMVNYRAERYQGTPIMVRRIINEKIDPTRRFWENTPGVEKWQVMCPSIPVLDPNDRKSFEKATSTVLRTGIFDLGLSMSQFWHFRASLSSILCMSTALGYRRVILCGVDLSSTGYFFD